LFRLLAKKSSISISGDGAVAISLREAYNL